MKTKITLLTALLTLASSLQALVNFGDAGTINFSLSGDLSYDSEIRSRASSQSDTILSIRPSLVYSRASKNLTLGASVGVIIQRYFDFTEYDDENFFFDLNISPNADVEKSRFSFSGDVDLNSTTRSNDQVGEIITTYNYGVSGELTYNPNKNYSVVSNASWRREDPQSNAYNQVDRFGGGVSLLVPFRKEMLWNLGIDLEQVQSDRNARTESDIWTYSTGISGTLMPKLSGSVSAGFQQREFDSGQGSTSPYFSGSLGWTIDDTTNMSFGASHSMGTTINDFATESTSLNATLSRQLNRRTSASAGVSYDISKFKVFDITAREDKSYSLNANLGYQLTEWGSLGIFGRYTDKTSDDATFEFDRYRVGIRFTGTW